MLADQDGGYFAIKGFLYQFDKTLIEALEHPTAKVAFENRQDIDYEDYVLQVKHKETQTYSAAKIRKAVKGLLETFSQDPSAKVVLYCHFADKPPAKWRLTMGDLNAVLGASTKKRHSALLRQNFLQSFIIRFSEDYESQFKHTLFLIKSSFDLKENDECVLYHSIFRSKLLDRCILPKTQRRICFADLKHFLDDAQTTVFYSAYAKYMGSDRYLTLVRKTFFTFSWPNLENFERLFLIECDAAVNPVDLVQLATRIGRRYYRKGKSPQPYVSFHNVSETLLNNVKRELFDQGNGFFDGTYFNGDRIRVDELTKRYVDDERFSFKIVSLTTSAEVQTHVTIKEVFEFFVTEPLKLTVSGKHRRIQIHKTEDVLHMIP